MSKKSRNTAAQAKKIIDLTAYFSPITKEGDLNYELNGHARGKNFKSGTRRADYDDGMPTAND